MSITEESSPPGQMGFMPFGVRPMEERDVLQVGEIDREAFPTMWPPPSFHRELTNPLARYLVAWQPQAELSSPSPPLQMPFLRRLTRGVQALLADPGADPREADSKDFVVGFVGIWFLADEAHITSIAVRSAFRRQGIGELLLIAALEKAVQRRCRVATLEVRVSNAVAQSLYLKYGFKKTGIRKGYYTDNNEDACVMETDLLTAPGCQEQLEQLIEAHRHRWGESARVLG
jgi:ribosomal-protein-alanine N-acetyltransferase